MAISTTANSPGDERAGLSQSTTASHTGRHVRNLPGQLILATLAFIIAALLPLVLSITPINLLGQFLALAILAVGLDLLWGYAGVLSLGQGVFFGLGGYLMARYLKLQGVSAGGVPNFMMYNGVHTLPWHWLPFNSFAFTVAAVLIIPAMVGFGFGLAIFRSRIRGVYFAILTQALAAAAATLAVNAQIWTGGSTGLTNFKSILGYSFYDNGVQIALFEASVFFLAAAFFFGWWLTRSRFGILLRAVRDGENRLRFFGYNPVLFKAFIFAVAALCAGVAGALYVPQNGIIAPAMIGVVPSIGMVIWVAVGGRGTLWGAVIGALIVNYAKYYCSNNFPSVWLYVVGALFVGTVLFFPGGIIGALRQVMPARWSK